MEDVLHASFAPGVIRHRVTHHQFEADATARASSHVDEFYSEIDVRLQTIDGGDRSLVVGKQLLVKVRRQRSKLRRIILRSE